jgi:Tfp pilus assembly protein FimV
MEHLGVVTAVGRNPRAYAGPVALLAAATVAIALVQAHLRSQHASPPAPPAPRVVHKHRAPKGHAAYVVRAGDTLDAIAKRAGIPVAHLLVLNPNVSPTALFIGEKLHLR